MVTAILACLLLGADPPATPAPGNKVLHVADGETLVLMIDGQTRGVRLLGVAPVDVVPAKAYHHLAAGFLKDLLAGQAVRLRYESGRPAPEKDGRVPAYLERARDGLDINREVVARGYGRADRSRRFGRQAEFLAREEAARADRLGLWAPGAAEAHLDLVRREAEAERRRRDQAARRLEAQRAAFEERLEAQRAAFEERARLCVDCGVRCDASLVLADSGWLARGRRPGSRGRQPTIATRCVNCRRERAERVKRAEKAEKQRCRKCGKSFEGGDTLCERCFMDSQK